MCDGWKNDFMLFYNWAVSNGYKEKLTIDRIDVNGNYEPSNCRWATMKEQCRNRRNNKLISYKGKTLCVSELAELLGINRRNIYSRLDRGFPVEKALEYK